MRHTSTSFCRATLSFASIPIRIIALLLRILAWCLDPSGGSPWNTEVIVRTKIHKKR